MCTRILGIAWLTARTAVRSRLFLSLVVLLLVVVVCLPMAVKGDGTIPGRARILLSYTLGMMAIILGVATLWTSCAAIAQEIESKQLHLVAVKPVHLFQVWLGKWFGLLFINAVLLCIAGASVWFSMWRMTAHETADAPGLEALRKEILTGRRIVEPRTDPVEDEARRRLALMIEQGDVPGGARAEAALAGLKKRIRVERCVVGPGRAKRWTFDLPGTAAKERPALMMRYRFMPAGPERRPVAGTWRVGTGGDPDRFVLETLDPRFGVHQVIVPAGAVAGDGRTTTPVTVEFQCSDSEDSQTVIFNPDEGIQLLVRESGFGPNFVRSLIIVLFYLALLAALGLCASAFFSLPVATFTASALVVIVMISHYFTFASSPGHAAGHHEEEEMSQLQLVSAHVLEGIHMCVSPAMGFGPLGRLSDGILVSWREVGSAALVLALAYPAILGVAGTWFLRRREIALPP